MIQANLSGIHFKIHTLLFVENCLQYNAMHDFSVRIKTGYNLADINQFD